MLRHTEQGCLYYEPTTYDAAFDAQSFASLTHLRWEGSPCTRGALINGSGRLIYFVVEHGIQRGYGYMEGAMVEGLWEGSQARGGGMDLANMRRDSRVLQYQSGCEVGSTYCPPTPPPSIQSNSTVRGSPSGTTAAPARSTVAGSATPNGAVAAQPRVISSPAAEANRCIQIIGQADYEAMGVQSNFRAVFRNTCPFQVDITWCVSGSDCNPGYSNLATIMAGSNRGITHTGPEPQGLTGHVEFAACRNGFAPNQASLSRQLLHACR